MSFRDLIQGQNIFETTRLFSQISCK